MSESRAVLLAAAAEEFAKTGLQGTRIQAIVKRAGVNERMIYHHFGSKEGLYRAVLDEQRAGLVERWSPVLAKAGGLDPYEGMRTALAGLVDILRARPLLLALLLHEALAGQRASIPMAEQLPAPLRDLYERGQREGVFRADIPFEIAYATAMAAIVALQIFSAPAAPDAQRGDTSTLLDHVVGRTDRVVGQLLDGMTGPAKTS